MMGEHLLKPLEERIDSCISLNCSKEETTVLRAALKTMFVKACRYDEIRASNPELVSAILKDEQPLENIDYHTDNSSNFSKHPEGNEQMLKQQTSSLVGEVKSSNKSLNDASTYTDVDWRTESDDIGCKVMIINSSDGLGKYNSPNELFFTEPNVTPCSDIEAEVSNEDNREKNKEEKLIFRGFSFGTHVTPTPPFKRVPVISPITIVSTMNSTELKDTVRSMLGHGDFRLAEYGEECFLLYVHSEESFELIQSELTKSKIQFYTTSKKTLQLIVPPITINSTIKYTELKDMVHSIVGHDDFKLSILGEECLELQVRSLENFKLIQSEFTKTKMQFHTSTTARNPRRKYLMRGIPYTVGTKDVKRMLEENGCIVDKVTRLYKGTRKPMHIVLIHLPRGVENDKELLNLQKIGDYDVEISRFRYYSRSGHPYKCHKRLHPEVYGRTLKFI